MGTSSCGLTQRILALSFLRSLCKSGAVGSQVSLPCNRAEGVQALNTFPRDKGDTRLEVSIGSSFLNFPQAVEHLVAIARAHPPPALHVAKIGEACFHVKQGTINLYLGDRYTINRTGLVKTSCAHIVRSYI